MLRRTLQIFLLLLCVNLYSQRFNDNEKARIQSLLHQAVEDEKNGTSEKIIPHLQEAESLSAKTNYHPDSTSLRQLIKAADHCLLAGKLEESRHFYEFVLGHAAGSQAQPRIADALYLKGIYLRRQNEPYEAIYNLKCALVYYKILKDSAQVKSTVENTEAIYYTLGNVAAGQALAIMNGDKPDFLEIPSVLFFGIYLGALMFCLIYNIYLYRFTGDKSYRELAKCIFCFTVYIYTVNNGFAAQWSVNQMHYTTIEFIKNNSSLLSNYFFATFIYYLLIEKKKRMRLFYHFLPRYKKALVCIIAITNILAGAGLIANLDNASNYLGIERAWFSWNSIIGLFLTIVFFVALFRSAFKSRIRINYLIYGFVLNLFFLSLSFSQTSVGNKFSHIPHPHALGAVLFLIFMTVAIADKINMYRKEKENAQAEALKNLEKLVTERTFDLEKQKQMLQTKNKEIMDSINYAKRIQLSILPSDKFLQRYLSDRKKGEAPKS
jgi:hypothetical protein